MATLTAFKTDIEICSKCKSSIVANSRTCSTCESDNGYPNVRQALAEAERDALLQRYNDAIKSADVGKSRNILDEFGKEILNSKAVRVISLTELNGIITQNRLMGTFYNQIKAGIRLPNHNDNYEILREQADTALFPHYKDYIHFAALTLNSLGVSSYGQCHIVLKEEYIKDRVTVFEENSCLFYEKHNRKIPKGYRSTWKERNILAITKLHSNINSKTTKKDFANILLVNAANGEEDFIELHIYGQISIGTFEKVTFSQVKQKADKVMVAILKEKLKAKNVEVA
jgi:hypothetical protein